MSDYPSKDNNNQGTEREDQRENGWSRVYLCGCGPGAGLVLHSYLHVEPCNDQASSAGAKLFFPHPGPVMGSSSCRQSANGSAARVAEAATGQWEARDVAGICGHGCSGTGACGQVVCSLLNKPISGRDALLLR